MTTAKKYVLAKPVLALTPGTAIRVLRELQGFTQVELARRAGMTQATISALETGHAVLGAERAKRLAVALDVHPAVLLFPNWAQEAKAVARELKRDAA